MALIQRLPQEVIDKIAAGEVIEDVANIIKELLDNSLDAGASNIRVSIQNFGLDLIRVEDDGIGMENEDIYKCFLPHTTSKIQNYDDLSTVTSIGFRGEAPHSIGVISTLNIKSRNRQSEIGNQILVKNGVLFDSFEIVMPTGTVVEITDVFQGIPVKRKALTSAKKTVVPVVQLITEYSMIHSHVNFVLISNKKKILDTSVYDHKERHVLMFGEDTFYNFVPVSEENEYMRICGFLCRPQAAFKYSNRQFIYVNNRKIQDYDLTNMITREYGNLLEVKSFPQFFLHLQTPVSFYDVNSHPKKESVTFYNKEYVSEFIKTSVRSTLDKFDLTYTNSLPVHGSRLKDSDEIKYMPENQAAEDILQVHKLFLIKQVTDGVLLIDQHAAHERIIYEKLLLESQNKLKDVKELPKPFLLRLDPTYQVLLKELMPDLERIGFSIGFFGSDTYQITSCPLPLHQSNLNKVILEVLEDLKSGKDTLSVDDRQKLILSYMACRAAIKSGDYLNPKERIKLFEELQNTKSNYTCPHGRPTKVVISLDELFRIFKRSGV